VGHRRTCSRRAARWNWGGSGAPLSEGLHDSGIIALVLLGSASDSEARQVLRKVPQLRDASEERLSALAGWAAALYGPAPGGGDRVCSGRPGCRTPGGSG